MLCAQSQCTLLVSATNCWGPFSSGLHETNPHYGYKSFSLTCIHHRIWIIHINIILIICFAIPPPSPSLTQLWIQRINYGVQEHGISYSRFMHSLARLGVQLNRKVLSELAIHEPRTFKVRVYYVRATCVRVCGRGTCLYYICIFLYKVLRTVGTV